MPDDEITARLTALEARFNSAQDDEQTAAAAEHEHEHDLATTFFAGLDQPEPEWIHDELQARHQQQQEDPRRPNTIEPTELTRAHAEDARQARLTDIAQDFFPTLTDGDPWRRPGHHRI